MSRPLVRTLVLAAAVPALLVLMQHSAFSEEAVEADA
jgi:hypothetical protein